MKQPIMATVVVTGVGQVDANEYGCEVNFDGKVRIIPSMLAPALERGDKEAYRRMNLVAQLSLLRAAVADLEDQVSEFSDETDEMNDGTLFAQKPGHA